MSYRSPPGEEELLQMWEDEGFRAATDRKRDRLGEYFDDLDTALDPNQRALVRTRLELRLREAGASLARVEKDGRGR